MQTPSTPTPASSCCGPTFIVRPTEMILLRRGLENAAPTALLESRVHLGLKSDPQAGPPSPTGFQRRSFAWVFVLSFQWLMLWNTNRQYPNFSLSLSAWHSWRTLITLFAGGPYRKLPVKSSGQGRWSPMAWAPIVTPRLMRRWTFQASVSSSAIWDNGTWPPTFLWGWESKEINL